MARCESVMGKSQCYHGSGHAGKHGNVGQEWGNLSEREQALQEAAQIVWQAEPGISHGDLAQRIMSLLVKP